MLYFFVSKQRLFDHSKSRGNLIQVRCKQNTSNLEDISAKLRFVARKPPPKSCGLLGQNVGTPERGLFLSRFLFSLWFFIFPPEKGGWFYLVPKTGPPPTVLAFVFYIFGLNMFFWNPPCFSPQDPFFLPHRQGRARFFSLADDPLLWRWARCQKPSRLPFVYHSLNSVPPPREDSSGDDSE